MKRLGAWLAATTLALGALGCGNSGKKSASLAAKNMEYLSSAVHSDVEELRSGLPEGAKLLVPLFQEAHPELPNPEEAAKALRKARDKVQDLRIAKSTFFAVLSKDGVVLRNDQEQDAMVGKDAFEPFPGLKKALEAGHAETLGTMVEAAGVRGRTDAQWVIAQRIDVNGEPKGLYMSGWSLSSYAYRLETGLRSELISNTPSGGKLPLTYVYLIVERAAYGAPVSPVVNGEAILRLSPLEHAKGDAIWTSPVEIDGRSFGVAVRRAPDLGENVAIALLRSEI